ncbi:hypothetical protein MITSMUL_05446 [Mitsuokella multacida DSM 20544]|uniref:Uncharacterized protein n=1 Tax=Mitsuokella multacida DSM 20544 TaxID=500635 RepID=C9KQD1_9FIRM|nr:hypothetical protein MITSMUL_05446 [Mitsuokella multacida DSM 20544]
MKGICSCSGERLSDVYHILILTSSQYLLSFRYIIHLFFRNIKY